MSLLEQIIAHGNRGHRPFGPNNIVCVDGFKVSVLAGGGTYCEPRPPLCMGFEHPQKADHIISNVGCEFEGPYIEVEVGFPSQRPEPWSAWVEFCEDPGEPTETVYGYVPVQLVRDLIAAHGGER